MAKRIFPQQSPRYGWPLIIAIIVHCLILIGFSLQLNFASKPPAILDAEQIQASLVTIQPASAKLITQSAPAAKPTPPVKRQAKPTPPDPKPVLSEQAPTVAVKTVKPPVNVTHIKQQSLQTALDQEIAHPVKTPKISAIDKKILANTLTSEIDAESSQDTPPNKSTAQPPTKTTITAKSPNATEVDRYKRLILQQIQQNWIVPQGVENQSCELRVDLAPGGMVLKVTLLKSSTNDALDRSAIAAINKASPLPAPSNSNDFSAFRSFTITVKPEGSSFDEL